MAVGQQSKINFSKNIISKKAKILSITKSVFAFLFVPKELQRLFEENLDLSKYIMYNTNMNICSYVHIFGGIDMHITDIISFVLLITFAAFYILKHVNIILFITAFGKNESDSLIGK